MQSRLKQGPPEYVPPISLELAKVAIAGVNALTE
jgi:hypothetical protein